MLVSAKRNLLKVQILISIQFFRRATELSRGRHDGWWCDGNALSYRRHNLTGRLDCLRLQISAHAVWSTAYQGLIGETRTVYFRTFCKTFSRFYCEIFC